MCFCANFVRHSISRETFVVEEDTLCVPKLYCSLRTCSLRVIDNDDGVEIMRVFQKVAPHVYRKNKVSIVVFKSFVYLLGDWLLENHKM